MAEPPSKSPGKSSGTPSGARKKPSVSETDLSRLSEVSSGLTQMGTPDLSGLTSNLSKAGGPPSYREAQEDFAKQSTPQSTPESASAPETTWDFLPYGYVMDPKLERVVRLAA